MRLMLFGATGQLGSSLVRATPGMEVTALPRTACDFAKVTKTELQALVEKHAPTHIVNAAAWAAVDDAEKHREETRKVNAQVPGWLGQIAAKRDIRLVHFSTDYVFDGERGAPYGEEADTHPVNHYGITKLEGEEAILASGAKAVIFRLQLLYQATGNSFFCRMLKLLAERPSLKVVADQISAPTSVADVTQAAVALLPRIAAGELSGIYHMAAQGHTSRHGFACAIREEMLLRDIPCAATALEPITSQEFPAPADRPKDTRLNTDKLAKTGIILPHWRTSLKTVMDEIHARH